MFIGSDPRSDTSARVPDLVHPTRRLFRRVLAAVLAAGALGGLAAAVSPVAASAAVRSYPAAVSATYYGETPQFECSYGQVTLQNIRIPNAELPVQWEAVVYYYGTDGNWYPYKQMYTAAGSMWEPLISSPVQNVYYQQPMSASVPHGYYYAVRVYMVPNASAGYQPHWDWASLSYGNVTGTSCAA